MDSPSLPQWGPELCGDLRWSIMTAQHCTRGDLSLSAKGAASCPVCPQGLLCPPPVQGCLLNDPFTAAGLGSLGQPRPGASPPGTLYSRPIPAGQQEAENTGPQRLQGPRNCPDHVCWVGAGSPRGRAGRAPCQASPAAGYCPGPPPPQVHTRVPPHPAHTRSHSHTLPPPSRALKRPLSQGWMQ